MFYQGAKNGKIGGIMKDKLKELYNLRRDLEIKLDNYNKMEYLREGKKWHEKMYRLVTETRAELNRLNKKIEFIENLKMEMKVNEMFYKTK